MLSTMAESLERYLDYLGLEKGLADLSLDSYRNDMDKFRRYLEKSKLNPEKLRQSELTGFLEYLRNSGLAPSSIARNLSSIKGYYRFLKRTGATSHNPAESITGPKLYRSHPGALAVEEVFSLLESTRLACQTDTTKKRLALRDQALLEFLYGTGARVSEAADSKRGDLYTEMSLVKLFGKGSKERVVPMGKAAWAAVKEYLDSCRPKLAGPHSADYLFLNNRGGRLSRMGIWKILNKYVKATGITKRVSPNTLRHSFATHLLAGGADLIAVQELLGHADITTTEIYTHLDKDFLISEHREFHPREKW
jgi:integrase/recombinase XerD